MCAICFSISFDWMALFYTRLASMSTPNFGEILALS